MIRIHTVDLNQPLGNTSAPRNTRIWLPIKQCVSVGCQMFWQPTRYQAKIHGWGPGSWKSHDPYDLYVVLSIARFNQTQHMGLRLNGSPRVRGRLAVPALTSNRPGYRKSEQTRRNQRSLAIGGLGDWWVCSTLVGFSSCSMTEQVGAAHNSAFVCFFVYCFFLYIQRYV